MHPTSSNGVATPITVFVATVSRFSAVHDEQGLGGHVAVVTRMTLMSEDQDHVVALAGIATIDGWALESVEEILAIVDADGVAVEVIG